MFKIRFTVDTHLFRELGELLVGRDSTALVELIKNSYDADATQVLVYGVSLDDPARGYIVVDDDGVGMDRSVFENGFLRIAWTTGCTQTCQDPGDHLHEMGQATWPARVHESSHRLGRS